MGKGVVKAHPLLTSGWKPASPSISVSYRAYALHLLREGAIQGLRSTIMKVLVGMIRKAIAVDGAIMEGRAIMESPFSPPKQASETPISAICRGNLHMLRKSDAQFPWLWTGISPKSGSIRVFGLCRKGACFLPFPSRAGVRPMALPESGARISMGKDD